MSTFREPIWIKEAINSNVHKTFVSSLKTTQIKCNSKWEICSPCRKSEIRNYEKLYKNKFIYTNLIINYKKKNI